MLRFLVVAVALAVAGCHGPQSPELHVLGVHEAPRHEVVFVELTNPASKPMRVTKLEYKFAADGTTLGSGELAMIRDVPAESSIVVEVPLETADSEPGGAKGNVTMFGTVTAELDQIVRSFKVSAQVQPH